MMTRPAFVCAKINPADNTVISIEMATVPWVNDYNANHTDSQYIVTREGEKGSAVGVGYTYLPESDMFMPPTPDAPGTWVFDEDDWSWLDLDAPKPDEGNNDDGGTPN